MRARIVGLLLVVGAVGSASGQGLATSPCPAGTTTLGIPDAARATQDACTQAYDLFQYMAPQLGLALAGGNAVLGPGGTGGGLGRFQIGARLNAVSGYVPDVANFPTNTSGAQRSTLPTSRTIVPLPTADVAIGLFGGIGAPIPFSPKVLGLDLLLSGQYVPTIDKDAVAITPKTNLQIGYGARLGLFEGNFALPTITATYLKRDLPETDIVGTAGSTTLNVNDAKVGTSAWRIVASKGIPAFGIAAGYGQETYDQSATISAESGGNSSSSTNVSQSLTRTNYFVDVAFTAIPLFKLVGEIGQASGGTVDTYNSFEGGPANRTMTYFSLGATFKW
jgi:hypothetical protein